MDQQYETDHQVEQPDEQSPSPMPGVPAREGVHDFTDSDNNDDDTEIHGQPEVGGHRVPDDVVALVVVISSLYVKYLQKVVILSLKINNLGSVCWI